MRHLSPFRINTSKKLRHLCIALIANDFKFTRINTSEKNSSKPPVINTSKKQGRGEGYPSRSPTIQSPNGELAERIDVGRASHAAFGNDRGDKTRGRDVERGIAHFHVGPLAPRCFTWGFHMLEHLPRYNPLRGIYEIHRRQTQKGPTQAARLAR